MLITGVTGSGKSSTMAAIVEHINCTQELHVMTLENPIEFLHRDKRSSITRRDIGTDTDSFVTGLKAAETGHLVISTVHTQGAAQTISRLVAVFERSEHKMV